jgi:transposase-like protein
MIPYIGSMKIKMDFRTLVEFVDYFKDEQTCQEHFTKIRFRNGEYCPHCGHSRIYRFKNGPRYRCAKCRKDFTIKTGTVFGESKLPLRKWFIAIYLLSTSNKGISSVQLAKQVGVTQKTAWFMDHRIRSALKQGKGLLSGTIELDETYVGGKEKNKHRIKRIGGTQGRNAKVKTPVFGLMQRNGEVRAVVTGDVRMRTIEKYIVRNAKPSSKLYTDDFTSYSRLDKLFQHEVVQHAAGEYVRNGEVHSNSIESFWAIFKRGFHGVYHQMSRKHLQLYIDEYTYRFNRRKQTLQSIFSNALERVSQSPTHHYKTLIGEVK